VYVGIIDEGYMYTHEDLAANAGTNPGEVAGNGVDDDGNGLVDDVYGWDFDGGNSSVFDGVGDDHGTHVAGTIGGVGGNGKGVAGVCWNVKLMDAKFLGRRGGTTANAIKAVDYFTDLKTRHNMNIVATSNSWGGGGFSQALQDAIERANAAGILFIAAAGNSTYNCDTSTACYPAEYPNANVLTVASITSTGAISSFSNYGVTTIDIGAPGSAIWSSVPASSKGKIISSYASYSGTSMATPHVSGAAALYAAYHPGSSAAQIKAAILGSAVPTASLSGKVATGGRLNVSGF
jgi:subtilisin family serine protease